MRDWEVLSHEFSYVQHYVTLVNILGKHLEILPFLQVKPAFEQDNSLELSVDTL